LRIKEQEASPILHEHGDDDDDKFIIGQCGHLLSDWVFQC